MKTIKLNITEEFKACNLVVSNIKKALETEYCSFITSSKLGDMFFEVHDGYVIFNKCKNDYWYIQSSWTNGERDYMSDVKKYAEAQWRKLVLINESK